MLYVCVCIYVLRIGKIPTLTPLPLLPLEPRTSFMQIILFFVIIGKFHAHPMGLDLTPVPVLTGKFELEFIGNADIFLFK